MFNILHLSYDLRTRFNTDVTSAVKNLIHQTEKLASVYTIDLLRVPNFKEEFIKPFRERHLQINAFGLPYGIFLLNHLQRVYSAIKEADRSGYVNLSSFNMIHAHKLTFEGYIGYRLACDLNVPLFVTLRQTDFWVLTYKPHLHHLYKNVLKKCDIIFYIVPYMIKAIEKKLGGKFFREHIQPKLVLLPNIVKREPTLGDPTYQPGLLLTALRMTKKTVIRKNIKHLFKAMSALKDENLTLMVIGEGEYLEVIKSWAKKYRIFNRVTFPGAVPNSEMDEYYRKAHAFVLPSYSESFGYVYAEALFNGTPILYSKGTGFDGMFENVGVALDPNSISSIQSGLKNIIENNDVYRQTIQQLHEKGAFEIFSPQHIERIYADVLKRIND